MIDFSAAEAIVAGIDWIVEHLGPLFWMLVGGLLLLLGEHLHHHLSFAVNWK